jgi:hypothetical protein
MKRMPKINLKRLLPIGASACVGAVLLLYALYSTVSLPLLGWSSIASLFLLLVLTLASSRFTVPVTTVDGNNQIHKSVADSFIFLAVMMFALPPANNFGPALILAAVVTFLASFRIAQRWTTVFAIGLAVLSTFVASLVYRGLVLLLVGQSMSAEQQDVVLNLLLFPLCVFGLIQYAVSTFGTAAFEAFWANKKRIAISQENLIWTLITQVASVTSAAMFYAQFITPVFHSCS